MLSYRYLQCSFLDAVLNMKQVLTLTFAKKTCPHFLAPRGVSSEKGYCMMWNASQSGAVSV